MRGFSVVPLSACLLAAVVAGPGARGQSAQLRIELLPSPAGPNTAQPQLSTSADGVLLSWIERSGPRATLNFSELTRNTWSPARAVASGTDWFVNWADVPSVIKLSDGTLAAHWLQKNGPEAEAYDVRLSYSKDAGRTWAASFMPHHDGTRTEHGFVSMLPRARDGLALIWLDGRAMTGGHGAGAHGAMALRFGEFDSRWKQVAETQVDGKVCECCPTAAAMTPDGPIIAFRNRTDDEVRDIVVSRQDGGQWTEPVAVSDDHWTLNACPVNGPALSVRGRDVALSWFTGSNNQPRAMVAFSKNAGRTFGAPVRIDETGTLGRVDVEWLDDGRVVASWIEHATGKAELRLRVIDRSGTKSAPVTVAPMRVDRSNGYPRLAYARGELIVAWTESVPATPPATGNALRVRTAIARMR
jgi:hypothetical protein